MEIWIYLSLGATPPIGLPRKMPLPSHTQIQIFDFSMTPDQYDAFEILKAIPPSEDMDTAIRIIRELDGELGMVKAQLLAVITLYRQDMMREMRSGFNTDEFMEGLAKVMAAPK